MSASELTSVFEGGWRKEGRASDCGPGSEMENTKAIRLGLPTILNLLSLQERKPATVVDAGTGDLFWLHNTDISPDQYQGFDVCEWPSWTRLRQEGWPLRQTDFRTAKNIGRASLVLCRDVMIHLPNDMCLEIIEKARQVAPYLLATTYVHAPSPIMQVCTKDSFDNFDRLDQASKKHAMLDLRLPPFNLGEPLLALPENYAGKYMGLWRIG